MFRHSRLQKEVLKLYGQCLRAAKSKPGFESLIKDEFRKNQNIPKSEILRIEFVLRQGWKKLDTIKDPHVNMSVTKCVNVWQLGPMRYLPALRIQEAIVKKILQSPEEQNFNTLLLVEHSPGIRTAGYPLEEENRLKKLGAEFFRTNRGGLITFHGPGQLVAYPILNLAHFRKSMKWYVCQLEQAIIRLCRTEYGLPAATSPHTGVWVGDSKLCALGIHGRKFVTSHGLALNCNVDLSWFSHIVPCGLQGKGVTSVSQQLGRNVDIEAVIPPFLYHFQDQFQVQLQETKLEFRNEILELAQPG